jgi:hypothetical protein
MCKNKIVLFIVFISILTVFTKGSFASNNQEEIKNLIETVIDSCALHPNGGFSFHKYLTDNYLIGESELQSVTYHIINYFWIDGIKVDSVDRRIVTVKCSRAAILTFYNNLNIRNDTIKIVLSLKKINKKNWKIDDIVNYKEFYLFGDDAVAYISVLLDDLKPTYYPPGEIDPSPLTKLYTPLMKYFHNNYVFTKEYLEKLSSRELRILRNKIFALY